MFYVLGKVRDEQMSFLINKKKCDFNGEFLIEKALWIFPINQ